MVTLKRLIAAIALEVIVIEAFHYLLLVRTALHPGTFQTVGLSKTVEFSCSTADKSMLCCGTDTNEASGGDLT